jgi:NAD(P)-dependent dehydrogenase (short-subunit alcohol dehydrogenase family)
VTSEESITAAVRRLDEEGFSPNILVNNAGVAKDQLLLRASKSDVEGVLATNLVGTMMLTKALLKVGRGGGLTFWAAGFPSRTHQPVLSSWKCTRYTQL